MMMTGMFGTRKGQVSCHACSHHHNQGIKGMFPTLEHQLLQEGPTPQVRPPFLLLVLYHHSTPLASIIMGQETLGSGLGEELALAPPQPGSLNQATSAVTHLVWLP